MFDHEASCFYELRGDSACAGIRASSPTGLRRRGSVSDPLYWPESCVECQRASDTYNFSTVVLSQKLASNLNFARSYGLAFWHDNCFELQCDASNQRCEVAMWKITTRGFTLQEVLILAAMNIAARTDSSRQAQAKGVAEQQGDQAWVWK
jgi:hypothetical protein